MSFDREDCRRWGIVCEGKAGDVRACISEQPTQTGLVFVLEKHGLILPIGPVFKPDHSGPNGSVYTIVDADPLFVKDDRVAS